MRIADIFGTVFNAAVNYFRPPIGVFNWLTFEVSNLMVKTYRDFKRETKARYATHDLVNRTSVLEYLGREPDVITFTMDFNRRLGVKPSEELSFLRWLCQEHVADQLILGNKVCGDNLWVIESVSEEVEATDHFGQVLAASAQVTMREYAARLNDGIRSK